MAGHDILHSVEFQMSLLLFMALGGYLLASRIGQPAVVGVILAGILIGPSGLNAVTYTDFVASLGHIGAVVLLFALGLEFQIKSIIKFRYFLIALVGVALPWLFGYIVAILFGFPFDKAILLGVALATTSTAITADTLRELGKLKTEAAQAIIGAVIIDDILALMAVSIANQLSLGMLDMSSSALFIVKASCFLVFGLLFGIRVLTPLIHKIDESVLAGKYPDFVFIFIVMTAFLYAMIAELCGLSAIVGAFIAGISLEHALPHRSKSFREGAEYLRIIFGAVFFISMGILVDFHMLDSHIFLFSLALTAAAIISKLFGCGLMARISGMNRHDSLVVGVGMIPRGEVSMTVALLAFTEGILEQPSLVAIIVMSLLTTLITPLLLKNWLYREKTGTENEQTH